MNNSIQLVYIYTFLLGPTGISGYLFVENWRFPKAIESQTRIMRPSQACLIGQTIKLAKNTI